MPFSYSKLLLGKYNKAKQTRIIHEEAYNKLSKLLDIHFNKIGNSYPNQDAFHILASHHYIQKSIKELKQKEDKLYNTLRDLKVYID